MWLYVFPYRELLKLHINYIWEDLHTVRPPLFLLIVLHKKYGNFYKNFLSSTHKTTLYWKGNRMRFVTEKVFIFSVATFHIHPVKTKPRFYKTFRKCSSKLHRTGYGHEKRTLEKYWVSELRLTDICFAYTVVFQFQ